MSFSFELAPLKENWVAKKFLKIRIIVIVIMIIIIIMIDMYNCSGDY